MKKAIRTIAMLLCAAAILSLFAACAEQKQDETAANSSVTPATEADTTAESPANLTISGDYAYFGSYPQREVVAQLSDSGVHGKAWETDDDCIIDPDLYNTLKNLPDSSWDANGDTTVENDRYRRTKYEYTVVHASGKDEYYEWTSEGVYHYFKFEPIKWIILEKDETGVFLLSEKLLDIAQYNTFIMDVTWENSTSRCWLNGYDSMQNFSGIDYSSNSFLNIAFTSGEQALIRTSDLKNSDNSYAGTEGGNDTSDKIFFLSEEETYGSSAISYGFEFDYNTRDVFRQAKSTTYAKAMGISVDCETDSLGNGYWWLRSPGAHTGLFVLVRPNGSIYRGGQHADSRTRGNRPAMRVAYK